MSTLLETTPRISNFLRLRHCYYTNLQEAGRSSLFINEKGSDLKQFKIANPTQENFKLIELALKNIKKQLDRANEDFNDTLDTPADAEDDAPAGDGKTGSNPKGKLSKKAKTKLMNLVHRPKDPQQPGLIKPGILNWRGVHCVKDR